jgi:hypothetical protein
LESTTKKEKKRERALARVVSVAAGSLPTRVQFVGGIFSNI